MEKFEDSCVGTSDLEEGSGKIVSKGKSVKCVKHKDLEVKLVHSEDIHMHEVVGLSEKVLVGISFRCQMGE